MKLITHVAPFLFLSLAVIGCGKPRVHRALVEPSPSSREEGWQSYDELPFGSPPRQVTAKAFDEVRSGMTLGELTDILGRGWVNVQYSGTGIIRWECADGRELSVWPVTYRQQEIIRVDGGSGGVGRLWMTVEDGNRAVEIPKK
jgi:hypothetical protein